MLTTPMIPAAANLGEKGGPQPRLVNAAHEFEAQMLKELLQPMTGTSALTGDKDESSSGSGSALGQFAAETLGRALSKAGGFGIANRIIHQLDPARNKASYRGNRDWSLQSCHENVSMTKVMNPAVDTKGKEQ